MVDILKASRGRPRRLDPEEALAIGQRLFHARSYDSVGLAALTEALGVKPPSFYAAFGSKAAFFGRILDRYAASNLPLDAFLHPGRPVVSALGDLLETAARSYAADPKARGCLTLEAARASGDAESVALACRTTQRRRDEIRAFIAHAHPEVADAVTDIVAITMSGLSAGAREGWNAERLVAVAKSATVGIRSLIEELKKCSLSASKV